jgi:glycine/D-amino acid oxidase-like deaminating enzyme
VTRRYDIVVVGGRIAGSILALRLARGGASVAIVDRDEVGTDTLSTHSIWPNGIARLDELGLLAPLLERHDLPFLRYRLQVLGHETVGTFTPIAGSAVSECGVSACTFGHRRRRGQSIPGTASSSRRSAARYPKAYRSAA